MTGPARVVELRCRECGWRESCGPTQIITWLTRSGKVRPGRAPELAILYELFRAGAAEWACPRCGKHCLTVGPEPEWRGETPCVVCGRLIDAERLEAIPGVKLCAACAQSAERGQPGEVQERCSRCGAPLVVRVSNSGGRTRYLLGCSANPPCAL